MGWIGCLCGWVGCEGDGLARLRMEGTRGPGGMAVRRRRYPGTLDMRHWAPGVGLGLTGWLEWVVAGWLLAAWSGGRVAWIDGANGGCLAAERCAAGGTNVALVLDALL